MSFLLCSYRDLPSTEVSTPYELSPSRLLLLNPRAVKPTPASLFCPQVTLIPGDGIGPELADSVKEIFKHINAPVEWDQYNVTGETGGDANVFKSAMESLKRNKVGLKGQFSSLFRRVAPLGIWT